MMNNTFEDDFFAPQKIIEAVKESNLYSDILISILDFIDKSIVKKTDNANYAKSYLMANVIALMHKLTNGDVCVRIKDGKNYLFAINNIVQEPGLFKEENNGEGNEPLYILENRNLYRIFTSFKNSVNFNDEKNIKKYLKLLEKEGLLSFSGAINKSESTPFVFSLDRLYLRRYFLYECNIAKFVEINKKNYSILDDEKKTEIVEQFLADMFDGTDEKIVDWSKVAVALATLNRFSIITGGPGTGKTTAVIKLLLLKSLLQEKALKILLCAPTGKAASRMSESIVSNKEDFRVQKRKDNSKTTFRTDKCIDNLLKNLKLQDKFSKDSLLASIREESSTIHKLLKTDPHRANPYVNENNKLACDVIIIDEASMIDLPIFSKLMSAIDTNTDVIFLGDKDQLCSVEAGSVLSDLCHEVGIGRIGSLSDEVLTWLSKVTKYSKDLLNNKRNSKDGAGITNNVAMLVKSYRFDETSGIKYWASVVNSDADVNSSIKDFINLTKKYSDISYTETQENDHSYVKQLIDNSIWYPTDGNEPEKDHANDFTYKKYFQLLVEGSDSESFVYYLDDPTLNNKLEYLQKALDTFRILCSNKQYEGGVDEIASLLERKIKKEYSHYSKHFNNEFFFPGQVVLITRNDSSNGLNNGDIGFTILVKDKKDDLSEPYVVVCFKKAEKSFKMIRPVFISDYASGFAITIHKSQGSEYNNVAVFISKRQSPILTKELLYTGITRAKDHVRVYASDLTLRCCLEKRIVRESGLIPRIAEFSEEMKEDLEVSSNKESSLLQKPKEKINFNGVIEKKGEVSF